MRVELDCSGWEPGELVEWAEEELFGELRSLLVVEPGEALWLELVHLLDGASRGFMEARAVPFLQAHLERWPDALRVIPLHWLRQSTPSNPHPGLVLGRTLDLSGQKLDEARLEGLFEQCDGLFGDVRRLVVDQNRELRMPGVLALVEHIGEQFGGLRHLSIRSVSLGKTAMGRVLSSDWIGQLESLQLGGNRIGQGRGWMQLFGQAPTFRPTWLDISDCDLYEDDVHDLVGTGVLEWVERLNLGGHAYYYGGHTTYSCLLDGVAAPALRSLELVGVMPVEELRGFATSAQLPSLERLGLGALTDYWYTNTSLDEEQSELLSLLAERAEGLRSFSTTSPPVVLRESLEKMKSGQHFTALDVLRVQAHRITMDDSQALNNCAPLQALERLEVEAFNFEPGATVSLCIEGLRRLRLSGRYKSGMSCYGGSVVAPERSPSLRWLEIAQMLSGNELAEDLIARPYYPRLERLVLDHNNLGVGAARALAAGPVVEELQVLDLSCNRIGDSGAQALVESCAFPRLQWMDLRSNGLQEPGELEPPEAWQRLWL